MRLPVSKVYRAFPELDEFDDDQCERFVEWAKSKAQGRLTVLPILGGVLWGLLVIVAAPIGYSLLPRERHLEWVRTGAMMLVAAAAVWSIGVAYLVRDWVLIRAIRDRVRGGRCPNCRFSLLGLPLEVDAVTCPECGSRMTLRELGLTARDLLVEDS